MYLKLIKSLFYLFNKKKYTKKNALMNGKKIIKQKKKEEI